MMAYLREIIEYELGDIHGRGIGDIDIHSDKYGVDISVFWHTPSFNVWYYPIVQVDDDEGNMILWREGGENSDHWVEFVLDVLSEYQDADDFWYIE